VDDFMVEPQNQGGAETSWVIGGGYIKFVGFVVVHQKTIGLLG
jgi:hypothetical protein